MHISLSDEEEWIKERIDHVVSLERIYIAIRVTLKWSEGF